MYTFALSAFLIRVTPRRRSLNTVPNMRPHRFAKVETGPAIGNRAGQSRRRWRS